MNIACLALVAASHGEIGVQRRKPEHAIALRHQAKEHGRVERSVIEREVIRGDHIDTGIALHRPMSQTQLTSSLVELGGRKLAAKVLLACKLELTQATDTGKPDNRGLHDDCPFIPLFENDIWACEHSTRRLGSIRPPPLRNRNYEKTLACHSQIKWQASVKNKG